MCAPDPKIAGDWPAPIIVLNENGASPIVVICEHASNHIPEHYGSLGLPPPDCERHIAYDIGAEAVARRLSVLLDAVCFLGTYSRLLIDLNRPLDSSTSIVSRSEDTDIPGNRALAPADRQTRIDRIFTPFHTAVALHLDARKKAGRATRIVAIHSFTPVYSGVARPWHAGILFERSAREGEALIAALCRDPDLTVAANQPYVIDRMGDYAIPIHGEDRGHPALLVEIRNDLICDRAGAMAWADRLADALALVWTHESA